MADIVLTTLNARYAHASFGLRYLMANLGELASRAAILEFDINQRPLDIVEKVLAQSPKIVGVGVYIWNASEALEVVADLKRLRPDMTVVLGGPEVSYETDQQEIARLADYVICGEGDLAFAELCKGLLTGRRPKMKVMQAQLPEFSIGSAMRTATLPSLVAPSSCRTMELPYHLYNEQDINHRVIYVEASRGCPFKCEFCLSSLDVPVRNVPLLQFLDAMQSLLDRGVKQFKFVDRTFNLNLNISRAILEFFLERYFDGLFLHFEMIPDRLPDALRAPIRKFPPGSLQFEVGVQTFNQEVAARISRRQDNAKLAENLRFLREETSVHVHADLIVGLPGENLDSFAAGFDRLVSLRPQEIQVGILKRLRGTPIVRHDAEWGMVYSPHAPYEVLETKVMDFATLQKMRRFARYWDLVANSGNFVQTLPMIWEEGSAFWGFMKFGEWLYDRTGERTHGIALRALGEMIFEYLTENLGRDSSDVARVLAQDHRRSEKREVPEFLRPHLQGTTQADRPALNRKVPARQAKHWAR